MGQFSLVVSSADDLTELSGSVTGQAFVEEEGAPALTFIAQSDNYLRWDTPGTANDFDFYVRWKIVGHYLLNGRYFGPCVRQGGSNNAPGYHIASGGATDRRSIYKIPADTELTNFMLSGVTDAYHWTRLQIVGSDIYGKAWLGDLEDEPASWDLTATDSDYTTAGYCGFAGEQMTGSTPVYVTHLYVGTDGDPAPIGGDPAEPEPLLWLPSQFRRMAIAGASVGPITHSASGTLAAGSAQVAGTARLLKTHAASGTLAAGSATVDGAASRSEPASTTHTASGALAAGSAQVDGAALRFAVHSASGALEAGAAQVDGAALRVVPVHTASGALAAGSATVSGTARRYATHTASGALIAGSAIVVGEAAKFAIHAADGTLTAGAATVAGTARLLKTHTASGVLTAGSATIAGTAGNAGTLTLTPADIQAVADAVWADPRALTVAKFLGLK